MTHKANDPLDRPVKYRKAFDLNDQDTAEQFISLCELQCTRDEVAAFFRVSKNTLLRRIKDTFGPSATWDSIFKEYCGGGKISLRRSQFQLAKKNAAMAIFLGKNILNQVDVKTIDDVNKPINITWTDAKTDDSVEIKVPAVDPKTATPQ